MPKKRFLFLLVISMLIGVLIVNVEGDSKKEETNFEKIDFTKNFFLETLNDVSTVKITCYLHLKITQVQLDIDFVGSASSVVKSKDPTTLAVNEEISVYGNIRNLQVIESDSTELPFETTILGNSTIIRFALSSEIPIGFTRNVKITYIQDTLDLVAHYNYKLGVDWQRRIGNQNVVIVFDQGLALLVCNPQPHSISTISNKLVLSWLEVNKFNFYTNLNFTSMVVVDDLTITPSEWNFGKIKLSTQPLEKVFSITNNENQFLEGTIDCPEWIETNVTDWELNIGETLFLRVSVDVSQAKICDGNVTFQFSFASYPVTIQISGQVSSGLSTLAKVLISIFSIFGFAVIGFGSFVLIQKRQASKVIPTSDEPTAETIITSIDLAKWKEILTEKEYVIFKQILERKELNQAELVRLTGLSKSTVSRAVGRLQTKGLIEKEKYGMSNLITINIGFFTKRQ